MTPRERRAIAGLAVLGVTLAGAGILAAGIGSVTVPPLEIVNILLRPLGVNWLADPSPQQIAVVSAIRLPRVVLALLVGAALACSGAAMQGLFRNPLADPGLLGVSSGASLGAVSWIVLGGGAMGTLSGLGWIGLPLAAATGSLVAVVVVYRVATWSGSPDSATLLLAGIAVNAVASAGTGYLTFMADDVQLRALLFWTLGSLSRANWTVVGTIAPFLLAALMLLPTCARGLNALVLGDSEAGYLGISVTRLRRVLIVLVSLGVGAAVAVSGVIAFVGLIVPQIVRILLGPDHRYLLPASAMAGAILMAAADAVARIIVAPAELPIGILTAGMGGPCFVWLLLRRRNGEQP